MADFLFSHRIRKRKVILKTKKTKERKSMVVKRVLVVEQEGQNIGNLVQYSVLF